MGETSRGLVIGLLLGIVMTLVAMLAMDHLTERFARVPPEKAAEYIHAVIEANRTNYTENVVNKMHDLKVVEAVEHWREEKGLPLPAQFLMESGRLAAQKDLQMTYRLASLSPI